MQERYRFTTISSRIFREKVHEEDKQFKLSTVFGNTLSAAVRTGNKKGQHKHNHFEENQILLTHRLTVVESLFCPQIL